MNIPPSKAIIEEVAQIRGISEAFVEKDWFVTQVIKLMAGLQFQDFTLVFTGGTALSKAHGLINRFSEDIDFKVLAPTLSENSRNQQSKVLSAFKKAVMNLLRNYFAINDDQIIARNENRSIAVELNYPTLFGRADALRPHILVELTVADCLLSPVRLPVSSFINAVAQKPPEIEQIDCVNPVENAADKLSAVSWRMPDRVRGSHQDDPDVVRHIHDLAILSKKAIDHPDFPKLVTLAMARDDKRSEQLAGLNTVEKLIKMLNILESDSTYPNEYRRFVNGMSYAPINSVPSYRAAVEQVRLLIEASTT